MALGGVITNPTLTLTVAGVLQFTCLVDGTVNTSPSTPLAAGAGSAQPSYFAMACSTCHTRYLIRVALPVSVDLTVQQTS